MINNTMKPRNPYSMAAKQRQAGPHGKTGKAQRALDKITLRKHLLDPKEV